MRSVHRILAFFAIIFLLYMGVTGTGIQLVDLNALFSHAPATDPNMQAIQESEDGPNNFVVIDVGDYAAPALPVNFDFTASLGAATHNGLGSSAKYLEWRMRDGGPVAQVKTPSQLLVLDAASGQVRQSLSAGPGTKGPVKSVQSLHNKIKAFHRGNTIFGDWVMVLGMIVGIAMIVMVISGFMVWIKLYRGRLAIGRGNPFWGSGGGWRVLHRGIALVSGVFLLFIAVTGSWLEFDSIYRGVLVDRATQQVGAAHAMERWNKDASSPLSASELPAMLSTTLASFDRDYPATPIKVLRLRYFSGYAQGIVISGGSETRQLVYNARNGQPMSQTEPGYPPMYFPLGWQAHETLKRIHRGDYFGIPGRVMSALSGFALIYLSISGVVMYAELWGKRRRIGRGALFWR